MSAEILQAAILTALRTDVGVQAIFGSPARIYDDETEAPAFPYAQLEHHNMTDRSASVITGADHRLSLAVVSRHGGLAEAKEALGAIKRVIEGDRIDVPGGHVVMQQVTYADTMRRADQRAFRGVLRIRMVIEEEEAA